MVIGVTAEHVNTNNSRTQDELSALAVQTASLLKDLEQLQGRLSLVMGDEPPSMLSTEKEMQDERPVSSAVTQLRARVSDIKAARLQISSMMERLDT